MQFVITCNIVTAVARKRSQIRIDCVFLPLLVRPRPLIDPSPLLADLEIHLAIESPRSELLAYCSDQLAHFKLLISKFGFRISHFQMRMHFEIGRDQRFHSVVSFPLFSFLLNYSAIQLLNASTPMNIGGQRFRTIWLHPANEKIVQLIDQRFLPHQFVIEDVTTVAQMADAIREMHVRGAGLIGASAGYGMYLATIEADTGPAVAGFDRHLAEAATQLKATRPTAVNLACAIDRQLANVAKGRNTKE